MADLVVGSADVAAAVVSLLLDGRRDAADRLAGMVADGRIDVQDAAGPATYAAIQGVDGRPLVYASGCWDTGAGRPEIAADLPALAAEMIQGVDGEPLLYEGRWVQMGAQAGGDGEKHGGTPVLLKDGVIEKGPGKFLGKKPGEISKRGQAKAAADAADRRVSYPPKPPEKKPGRRPLYATPWDEHLAAARVDEVAKVRDEYEKMLAVSRKALEDFRRHDAGDDPTARDILSEIETLESARDRRIGKIEWGDAYDFEAKLEKRHLDAVIKAVKEGKDVPMEVLLRYEHSDGMPETGKRLVARHRAVKASQEDAVAFAEKLRYSAAAGRDLTKEIVPPARVRAARVRVIAAARDAQKKREALTAEMDREYKAAEKAFEQINTLRDKIVGRVGPARVQSLTGLAAADLKQILPPDDADLLAMGRAEAVFNEVDARAASFSERFVAVKEEMRAAVRGVLEVPAGRPRTTVIATGDVLPPNTQRALEFLGSVLSADTFGPSVSVPVHILTKDSWYGEHRAYCRDLEIHVTADESTRTIVHEIGHVLEHVAELSNHSKAFLLQRSPLHEPTRHLGDNYEDYEAFRPDRLIREYAGKWYRHDSTEIISMGLEYLLDDPVRFATEAPEQFEYVLAVAHGDIKGTA